MLTGRTLTAATIALVLLAVFGVLGFGWRSWLQHRRTGSTGFRGVSGRIGSVEWVAGVGFVVALVATVVGPALQLCRAIVPLRHAEWIHVTGIVVATIGIALTVWAQLDMGDAWRIGVDASETTELVQRRVFGLVRNPIYTAMLVFDVGIVLLTPNFVTIAGLVLAIAALELQVRHVEEPYLLAKHGAAYRRYTARVGRFIPGVGLIR
jgi:protein-S-isoprenylcysteine O-methyltransferase Ste14